MQKILITVCSFLLIVLQSVVQAGVTVQVSETGGDVLFQGNGTIDLTDLTFDQTIGIGNLLSPGSATMTFGNSGVGGDVDLYGGLVGPSSFGSNINTLGPDPNGDAFALTFLTSTPANKLIGVPQGYTTGQPLSFSQNHDGETFDSLGLVKGSYLWRWGSGPTLDFLELNIGVVPEPSTFASLAMLGLCLATRFRV